MGTHHHNKRASMLPLVAVSMAILFIMLAVVVDFGWIFLAQNQLQNTADASALAAATELIDEDILHGNPNQTDDIVDTRDYAEIYAALNQAAKRSILLDRNDANNPNGDVVVGYIEDPNNYLSPFESSGVSEYNSVKVQARLAQTMNGPLGLFFGTFTGVDQIELSAETTASIDDRILGFDIPLSEGGECSDERIPILPFTIFEDSWKVQTDGDHYCGCHIDCPPQTDIDHLKYNTVTGEVQYCAGDGIPEVKLYPNKWSVCTVPGLPGNFGTIDIGPSDNSTSDLIEQIYNGVSREDLDAIGGLILSKPGCHYGTYSMWLNGDSGVSSAVKTALEDIIGEPRILPLFGDAYGGGDNVQYKIVAFVGVRIMEVKLTGALDRRYVYVQPVQIMSPHAVVDPDAPKSGFIYAQGITR